MIENNIAELAQLLHILVTTKNLQNVMIVPEEEVSKIYITLKKYKNVHSVREMKTTSIKQNLVDSVGNNIKFTILTS